MAADVRRGCSGRQWRPVCAARRACLQTQRVRRRSCLAAGRVRSAVAAGVCSASGVSADAARPASVVPGSWARPASVRACLQTQRVRRRAGSAAGRVRHAVAVGECSGSGVSADKARPAVRPASCVPGSWARRASVGRQLGEYQVRVSRRGVGSWAARQTVTGSDGWRVRQAQRRQGTLAARAVGTAHCRVRTRGCSGL